MLQVSTEPAAAVRYDPTTDAADESTTRPIPFAVDALYYVLSQPPATRRSEYR